MDTTSASSKVILQKNGYVEVFKPEVTYSVNSNFYQFLARLLVEDKQIQIKKENRPL